LKTGKARMAVMIRMSVGGKGWGKDAKESGRRR